MPTSCRSAAALEREVADGGEADVVEQRLLARQQAAAEEDALAEPRAGDLELVEAAGVERGLEDQRGGQHDVRPRGLDAGQRTRRGGPRGERAHERTQRPAGDLDALHAARLEG